MNLVKRIYFILMTFLIVATGVYYYGCASAETTTGKLAFQQKEYEKAEVELKKGLAIDPKDDEAWYMLGVSQVEIGKFDEAKNSFKQSLAISSNYAEGIRTFWIEKYNAGVKEYQSGIDTESKGDSSGARSYYTNALKYFQASYSIFPDSLKALSAVGDTYFALGQTDKALDIFTELASKSNSKESALKVARILYQSGLAMMQSNNLPAAIETFNKIISISALPKDDQYYEVALFNIGLALAKTGEEMKLKDENSNYKEKFQEALTYLEPLTQSTTASKELKYQLYDILVKVYAYQGMNDKAEDALKKRDEFK